MRPVLRRLALFALPALILLLPASASAFPLTNCTVDLTSVDKSGNQLATATGGGNDSTLTNPFIANWDGSVKWVGTMGTQVIKDYKWSVSIFNVPTPLGGADANADGKVDGAGTVQVAENLPFQLVGLFYVSGSIAGSGGDCAGSGWMKLDGNPVGTLQFWAFLILLVLGLLMMVMGYRGARAWAVIGGLVFGIGGALGLITFALMLVGQWTPLAAIGGGLVLGIIVAFIGPKPTPAPAG